MAHIPPCQSEQHPGIEATLEVSGPIDPVAESIFAGQELPDTISVQTAIGLFSYADTVPGATGESDSASAEVYANELVDMYAEVGGERLIGLARTMVESCQQVLTAVQVEGSPYSRSITWGLWDLAKQRHMSNHPEAVAPEYQRRKLTVGGRPDNTTDPLSDVTKLWDIVDRQLGWEMQREALEDRPQPARSYPGYGKKPDRYPGRFSSALQANPRFGKIEDRLKNGDRNSTNAAGPNSPVFVPALRSYELSAIGEQVRLAALEIQDGGAAARTKLAKNYSGHQSVVELFGSDSKYARLSQYDQEQNAQLQQQTQTGREQRARLVDTLYRLTAWRQQETTDAHGVPRTVTIPSFVATGYSNEALTLMLLRRMPMTQAIRDHQAGMRRLVMPGSRTLSNDNEAGRRVRPEFDSTDTHTAYHGDPFATLEQKIDLAIEVRRWREPAITFDEHVSSYFKIDAYLDQIGFLSQKRQR